MKRIECPKCYSNLGNRENVYGTFCQFCGYFIKSEEDIPIKRNAQLKLLEHQNIIRKFLRKKILGERNGN